MSGSSKRTGMVTLLARSDTGGLVYGAVVSGAALAATSAHATGSTRVVVSTVLALVVYWLAHVYVHVLSKQLGGSDTRALPRRISASIVETSVLLGGVPAIAVYVVAIALGAGPSAAGYVALIFLVVLLSTVGYLGAYRARITGASAYLEAAGAGLFGVLIILMKVALH